VSRVDTWDRATIRDMLARLAGGRPSPTAPGVYLIRCSATGLIKIGYATNVRARLSGLQTGSAAKLELLCTVDPVLFPEKALHQRFREDRAHGEWFRPSRRLRAFLRSRGVRLP
jgi:hypothetical protein